MGIIHTSLIHPRIYALRALLTSLSPLIGAELELGHAVPVGWADSVSKDRLDEWREDGMELKQEVEETLMDTFNSVYWPLMRKVCIRRRDASVVIDQSIL
jgi:protein adenylyltransferase